MPVQHVRTTFGAGGDGWRQPPEPPVTAADGRWEPYAETPWEPETVTTRPAPAGDAAGAGEFDVPSPRSADGDPAGPWESVSPAPGPSWRTGADTGSWRAEPAVDAGLDDEPEAQPVSTADAARVARLDTEVRVVDGRPRYHLATCLHLFARDHEPLPVSEAVSLGFTPCADCAPDTALLADAAPS
ncbi:hypothetical protein [Micromonospora coxensis]|uniref:hypothetical protein n=1 Tax=Micromonospora coxensis TaxID=356852 RepID=UPI003F5700E3